MEVVVDSYNIGRVFYGMGMLLEQFNCGNSIEFSMGMVLNVMVVVADRLGMGKVQVVFTDLWITDLQTVLWESKRLTHERYNNWLHMQLRLLPDTHTFCPNFCLTHIPSTQTSASDIYLLPKLLPHTYTFYPNFCLKHIPSAQTSASHIYLLPKLLLHTYTFCPNFCLTPGIRTYTFSPYWGCSDCVLTTAKSADMPGSVLPLWHHYTNSASSVESNHCFQTNGTYRNYCTCKICEPRRPLLL